MSTVHHKIKHHYQPTNNTCGYTALATLLSYYDIHYTPEELVGLIPQPKDSAGTSHGSVTAQLADWCQKQGFNVHMYVSDMYILDLSWTGKTSKQIKERLEQVRGKRTHQLMDAHWVHFYEDAYLAMLNDGAAITITQFITTKLINKLLKNGPVFVNICSTALRGKGRTTSPELRVSAIDDIKGNINTHSVVVYGMNKTGDYLVSDPWDGLIEVDPEQLVLAIEAAQIECDNQIFVIKRSAT